MKDFEMLRNFLSEKIHDADNRSFDTNAATLEIYFDDMGFFTASGEWADVQLLMNVDYKKTPIYGIYEDRYGDSHSEVNSVTLEEESRDIAICSSFKPTRTSCSKRWRLPRKRNSRKWNGALTTSRISMTKKKIPMTIGMMRSAIDACSHMQSHKTQCDVNDLFVEDYALPLFSCLF